MDLETFIENCDGCRECVKFFHDRISLLTLEIGMLSTNIKSKIVYCLCVDYAVAIVILSTEYVDLMHLS